MDYEFHSQKELFQRVRPALRSKCSELQKLGFSDIKEFDVWNYLIATKWRQATGLMLSDVVSDIFNAAADEVDDFLHQNKTERTQEMNKDLDVI